MVKLIDLILKLLEFFGRHKKTPQEIEDAAKKEVADNTLDDDVDTLRDGLR